MRAALDQVWRIQDVPRHLHPRMVEVLFVLAWRCIRVPRHSRDIRGPPCSFRGVRYAARTSLISTRSRLLLGPVVPEHKIESSETRSSQGIPRDERIRDGSIWTGVYKESAARRLERSLGVTPETVKRCAPATTPNTRRDTDDEHPRRSRRRARRRFVCGAIVNLRIWSRRNNHRSIA